MKFNTLITIGVIVAITQGCAKKSTDSDTTSVSDTEAVVESGVSIVSGSLDEQSNASFAFRSEKVKSIWQTLLIDKAYAAGCSRAFLQTCTAGIREITYSNCSTPNSLKQMDGSVKLTYSNASCSMTTDGDSVVRTYSTTITGPRGGSISNSSDSAQDYRATGAYGGGSKVTKTAAGYNLDIFGKHVKMEKNGRELFNVSVKSLTSLQVTGGLTRALRKVSNGQLEINHNIAKFTSVITASNLQWSATCCHPTSGTLSITHSGSKTGTATVTFSADECGVASLEENGQTSKIELSYCE